MRRFALLFLLTPALLAAPQPVAILAYHQVEKEPKLGWSVSTEDFQDQMDFLAKAGFHVVGISDAYDYLSGKTESLPANPVVITVDDGFVDAATQIAPALNRFGYPWSLYIYPNFISHGKNALSWEQIARLKGRVDIESHTLSHPHLIRNAHPEMSDAEYAAWLDDELAMSKAAIEKKTGRPVRFLAYPYGDWDAGVTKATAAAGYVAGLTSWAGLNTTRTRPLELRRFPMTSDTTIAQFAAAVGAQPLELRDVLPAPDGFGRPLTISATIGKPEELDPSTVRVALLGETANGTFDAATGRATLSAVTYTRARHHVLVYGVRTSDGRPATASWTFYTSAEAKVRYAAAAQRLRELPLHHTQTKRE